MGVIDELVAKLKSAKRACDRARKDYQSAADDAGNARKALDAQEARVAELESAISILRNNLKPAASSESTVTQLIRK